MATFRTNRWDDGVLTSSYNSLLGRIDDAADAIAAYTEVTDGYVISSNASELVIGFIPSGTLVVQGSGLTGTASSVTINRLSLELPTLSLTMTGALTISDINGALVYSGGINAINFTGPGVTVSGTGSYRFTLGGDLIAFNATESLRFADGASLTAKTNAAGQYTSFEFTGSGFTFSASGVWAYGSVSSFDDLLSGPDVLVGTSGRDFLPGGRGSDRLEGGAGIDTAVYSAPSSNFSVTRSGDNWAVSSLSFGSDLLVDVERVKFSNKTVALDLEGNAGQIYRLYKAAFDRTPDLSGLGFWLATADSGMSLDSVASEFILSTEFRSLYGASPTNAAFVSLLYNNVLDRQPDPGGYQYWVGLLDGGRLSREQVLLGFSESTENKAAVIGVIGRGIDFTLWQG